MIRFYSNMPIEGSVIIVKITTIDSNTQNHRCKLLEYGNIDGTIVRSECKHSSDARKKFLNLKIGDIIPVIYMENNQSNGISLIYSSMNETDIDTYINNYKNMVRIINTITMFFMKEEYKTYKNPIEIILQDEEIKDEIQRIIYLIIDSFDNITATLNAFLCDTYILYDHAIIWRDNEFIKSILDNLLQKYPLPKESINIRFKYECYHCNAIEQISNTIDKLKNIIQNYNSNIKITISVDTSPYYIINFDNVVIRDIVLCSEEIKKILFDPDNFSEFEECVFDSEKIISKRINI